MQKTTRGITFFLIVCFATTSVARASSVRITRQSLAAPQALITAADYFGGVARTRQIASRAPNFFSPSAVLLNKQAQTSAEIRVITMSWKTHFLSWVTEANTFVRAQPWIYQGLVFTGILLVVYQGWMNMAVMLGITLFSKKISLSKDKFEIPEAGRKPDVLDDAAMMIWIGVLGKSLGGLKTGPSLEALMQHPVGPVEFRNATVYRIGSVLVMNPETWRNFNDHEVVKRHKQNIIIMSVDDIKNEAIPGMLALLSPGQLTAGIKVITTGPCHHLFAAAAARAGYENIEQKESLQIDTAGNLRLNDNDLVVADWESLTRWFNGNALVHASNRWLLSGIMHDPVVAGQGDAGAQRVARLMNFEKELNHRLSGKTDGRRWRVTVTSGNFTRLVTGQRQPYFGFLAEIFLQAAGVVATQDQTRPQAQVDELPGLFITNRFMDKFNRYDNPVKLSIAKKMLHIRKYHNTDKINVLGPLLYMNKLGHVRFNKADRIVYFYNGAHDAVVFLAIVSHRSGTLYDNLGKEIADEDVSALWGSEVNWSLLATARELNLLAAIITDLSNGFNFRQALDALMHVRDEVNESQKSDGSMSLSKLKVKACRIAKEIAIKWLADDLGTGTTKEELLGIITEEIKEELLKALGLSWQNISSKNFNDVNSAIEEVLDSEYERFLKKQEVSRMEGVLRASQAQLKFSQAVKPSQADWIALGQMQQIQQEILESMEAAIQWGVARYLDMSQIELAVENWGNSPVLTRFLNGEIQPKRVVNELRVIQGQATVYDAKILQKKNDMKRPLQKAMQDWETRVFELNLPRDIALIVHQELIRIGTNAADLDTEENPEEFSHGLEALQRMVLPITNYLNAVSRLHEYSRQLQATGVRPESEGAYQQAAATLLTGVTRENISDKTQEGTACFSALEARISDITTMIEKYKGDLLLVGFASFHLRMEVLRKAVYEICQEAPSEDDFNFAKSFLQSQKQAMTKIQAESRSFAQAVATVRKGRDAFHEKCHDEMIKGNEERRRMPARLQGGENKQQAVKELSGLIDREFNEMSHALDMVFQIFRTLPALAEIATPDQPKRHSDNDPIINLFAQAGIALGKENLEDGTPFGFYLKVQAKFLLLWMKAVAQAQDGNVLDHLRDALVTILRPQPSGPQYAYGASFLAWRERYAAQMQNLLAEQTTAIPDVLSEDMDTGVLVAA